MTIAACDYDFLRRLVHEEAAIVLEPGKEYLVETRLGPVAEQAGLHSVGDLVDRLRRASTASLRGEVVDAMTINETSWFRDRHPFETLCRTIVPDVMDRRALRRSLVIWSLACSTGQEAYSVTMALRDSVPALDTWAVRVIGTDVSPTVLHQARAGRYSPLEIRRGLPTTTLRKYFQEEDDAWVVGPELRSAVSFWPMNLVGPWPALPTPDIVLIRNVLIYFDQKTKRSVLERLRPAMAPDGWLLLGGAEAMIGLDLGFDRVTLGATTWYRPTGHGPGGH